MALARHWRLAWVIAACVALFSLLVTAQESELQSRFHRTVQSLQDAADAERGAFAATALVNLSEAYIVEAEAARQEARVNHDASLRGWSVAVDQFTRQLPLLLEDIELGFPVNLSVDAGHLVAVTVADRTVILSHPRPSQQSEFEQQILTAFCLHHTCETFKDGFASSEPIPVSLSQVRPNWIFTEQGPICSHLGIVVRFGSQANIASARQVCEQFLQEVLTLVDEISWQRRYAVEVDWNNLVIEATPRRPEHRVQLNGAGDSVLVTVPVLFSSPALLRHVLPWVQQRLEGIQEPPLELEAARYGWEKS